MKNSTKFVWIVLGAIAVILIILTVMVRSLISEHIVVNNDGNPNGEYSIDFSGESGPMESEDYNFQDFDEIRIVGGWDVLVIADDEYHLSVEVKSEAANDVIVEKRGGVLYLGLNYSGMKRKNDFHGASATVYMPVLTAVDVDGAVNMNVEDFIGNSIEFSLDGAGQIIGENCVFDNLITTTNGAINFDFSESDVENAEVYVEGAGNVELNMTGGELTGKLAGLSNLEYRGEVSRLDVEKDGIGGISKKE